MAISVYNLTSSLDFFLSDNECGENDFFLIDERNRARLRAREDTINHSSSINNFLIVLILDRE